MPHRIRFFFVEFGKDGFTVIALNLNWHEFVIEANAGLQLATTAVLLALTLYRAKKLLGRKRHNPNNEIDNDK
ncbi:MAG: hypothetical protein IPP15_16010 [Saprospiraceae bacterium]|uniref:Uncharacterized protein n=1 Tax=Candidatus Opimibacter skivensis TaxID=2982028 RepID=A0A9D7XUL5_9BACT|nr:hypothetical protein [Candidatus Opimibacter skivensis]